MGTFATSIGQNGTLHVPLEALNEFHLQQGDKVIVRLEPVLSPQTLDREPFREDGSDYYDDVIKRMTSRTPEQIREAREYANRTYHPLITPKPGNTIWDEICGQWPGDETDEDIVVALAALD